MQFNCNMSMVKAFQKLSPCGFCHTNLIFNHNSFRCWALIQWSQYMQLMLFKILYSIIICCNSCHNYLFCSMSYLRRMDLLVWMHQILVNLVSKHKQVVKTSVTVIENWIKAASSVQRALQFIVMWMHSAWLGFPIHVTSSNL